MTSTVQTIVLQGIDLLVSRKGRGQPLLLLHGGGGPVFSCPFADALAQNFEVIEPIHPGFSGTQVPKTIDGVSDLAYLYLDLLDALDLKSVTLVGISLGGWVANEIAVRNLSRISRLVLVDAVGVKLGSREERDFPDVFATDPREVERLMWHDMSFAPVNQNLDDAGWQAVAQNFMALGVYAFDPYMHNPKLKGLLHRVTVPTLVLWGAQDRFAEPSYGEAYARLIPGSRFELIDNAGHAPHVEQPVAVAQHVLNFAAA
ncbi:alpha/beta fold hydrolase [Paraburkholderia fungorum]|uniref:alpha/beta fold hydrolase n=1 Tax=Paraburkholderia fungorum TaxID=134537 RepID=UPI001C1ED9F8|nr:alpha/beta hydrolase [Paraburkholderia fungorum]MBU7443499.1 alpha/beta hydrolase [Paraburkholderia fungorum]